MDDDVFHALREQAQALADLTKHPGWEVLVDGLNHRMRDDKVSILNGNVADIETYRKRAGRLSGIHEAIDFPQLIQKMVDAEYERRGDDAA